MPESDLWLRRRTQRFGAGIGRLLAGDLSPVFYLALLITTVNGGSYWLGGGVPWPVDITPRAGQDVCEVTHVNGYNPVGVVSPPALPTGLGNTHAVINPYPYTVQVIMVGNAGGTALVFFTGMRNAPNGYDNLPAGQAHTYLLGPGQGVYFGGFVPSSWVWAGL